MTEPFKKVTEVEGHHIIGFEWDEIALAHGGVLSFEDILPDKARTRHNGRPRDESGPRGRFRITVEFYPEEP